MADVEETTTREETDSPQVHYRQSIEPWYYKGSFVVDDTDNHDFRFAGRGKGRLSIAVDCKDVDKVLTVTLYGMHVITGSVGDTGVFELGSFVTVASTNKHETCNDPFPFYLVRVTSAAAATADPTCTMYFNCFAF